MVASAAFAQAPDLQPSPKVKELAWMVGTWTGDVKFDMQGMKMESKSVMTCKFEGKFLHVYSTMDMMGMKMTESMYFGWDDSKKEYFSYAFTNMSTAPRFERGNVTGKDFVTVSDPWQVDGSPEPTVSRATMTRHSDTMIEFKLEFKEGEKWTVVGTGKFSKGGAVKGNAVKAAPGIAVKPAQSLSNGGKP